MTNEVLKEKTLVAVRTLAQLRDKAELLSASNYRCLVRVGPSLAALRAVECHRPLPVWQATARRQAIRTWEDRDQRMLREKERADAHKSVVAELIRYGEIGSSLGGVASRALDGRRRAVDQARVQAG
jgi:hypothetical protein